VRIVVFRPAASPTGRPLLPTEAPLRRAFSRRLINSGRVHRAVPPNQNRKLPSGGLWLHEIKHDGFSRPSGMEDDDYNVLADGAVVGRIFHAAASPVGSPWMWTLAYEHHEDRTPTHGYAATREDAMIAFAKSWRRE
jgi:hypothetical protein